MADMYGRDLSRPEKPIVSIIIPCYNHARYLPEALASVVAQTVPQWEAVIVDDGSSDDSALVAQHLITRYSKWHIQLLRGPNRGPSESRNAGIAATSAPYILTLDADDLIAPTMLERTLDVLAAHKRVGFVSSNVRFFGDEQGSWSGGAPTRERLVYDCRLVVTSLFRRVAWQQVGGFGGREVLPSYEDWDFWLRLVECGWQGRLVPEPLALVRRRFGGRLHSTQQNDLQLRARLIRYHPALYPLAFQPWASSVLREEGRPAARLLWWRWFAWYAALIARHAPHELPKTLLRPAIKGLAPRDQMQARRLARLVGLSRSG